MRLLPLLTLALAAAACADAPDPDVPDSPTADPPITDEVVSANFLALTDPYVRAAPAGGVSAMFARIENGTAGPDTLVAARTEAAGRVEIHQTRQSADGLSEMAPVEGGLPVPAGGAVALEPGGLHVMLLDLQRDLAVGDTVEVALTFSERGPMAVRVPVRGL